MAPPPFPTRSPFSNMVRVRKCVYKDTNSRATYKGVKCGLQALFAAVRGGGCGGAGGDRDKYPLHPRAVRRTDRRQAGCREQGDGPPEYPLFGQCRRGRISVVGSSPGFVTHFV